MAARSRRVERAYSPMQLSRSRAIAPGDNSRLAAAAPLLFVFLWSTGYVGARYGLPYAAPFTLLTIRMGLSCALLTGLARLTRTPLPRGSALRRSAITGLFLHGGYLGGVFLGIHLGVPAGLSAVIVNLQPVVTSVLAGRLLGEHVSRRQWLGLALGFGGVSLAVGEKLLAATDQPISGWGVVASVVALLAATAGTIHHKRHGDGIALLSGTAIQYATAFVGFAVVAAIFERGEPLRWTHQLVFALAWMVFVLSLGAILLLLWLIRTTGASSVSKPALSGAPAYRHRGLHPLRRAIRTRRRRRRAARGDRRGAGAARHPTRVTPVAAKAGVNVPILPLMQIGLLYSLQAPPEYGRPAATVYRDALDEIAWVDANAPGIHSVWLTEHHGFADGYLPSPMIVAGAIAARTRRLRIAQGIVLLPLYGHPLRLAEDAAVIDVLSDGRFELGVGMGYRADEFDSFGIDLRTRKGRFEEGLDILRHAFTGERFTYEGRYYNALDAILTPPPVQHTMPIWLGAATPLSRRRVAPRGHNLLISLLTDLEHTRSQFEDFRAAKPTGRTALIRECWIGELEEILPHLHYTYRKVYAPPHAMFVERRADGTRRQVTDAADPFYDGESFWRDRFIIGNPAEVATEIRRYRDELGIDELVLRLAHPGVGHQRQLESLRALSEDVLTGDLHPTAS